MFGYHRSLHLIRVTGYHRPIKNFNAGKTAEVQERLMFKVDTDKLEQGEVEISSDQSPDKE